MPTKNLASLAACLLIGLGCGYSLAAQERAKTAPQSKSQRSGGAGAQDAAEDILRVNTRAVFVDTLVRDKKTNAPVSGLARESFQVLDDGKPRALAYFNGEGVGRVRPLALVLVLDLCTESIVYLERPEVMEHVISALARLQPTDEVAVAQTWCEPDAPLSFQVRSKTVEGLTPEREKTYAALRGVQKFAQKNLPEVKMLLSLKSAMKATWKEGILAGIKGAAGAMPTDPPINVTVAPDFEYMIGKAPLMATQERPGSQVVVVEVSDGLEGEGLVQSEETAKKLIDSGVIVSGLAMKKNLLGKLSDATGRVISPLLRQRFRPISYYGRQTGGEVVTVATPEQFAAAVDRIIGGIAARYSLGFSLADADLDDGHMHKLEVKVRALDGRGRARKLVVSSRRGYYSRRRAEGVNTK
jgi:VWFA-related protein